MPGIKIVIDGDSRSFEESLKRSEQAAAQYGPRIAARLNERRAGQLNVIERALTTLPNESLLRPKLEAAKKTLSDSMQVVGTAAGEIAGKSAAVGWIEKFRQKFSGAGSGGMSQLISVVSNTMSSLGSGINPARILAQQGPNVLQAFVSISGNALALIAKFAVSLSAIGAIIAAPFIYLARVNSIAKNLSKFQLPDVSRDYIGRVNAVADAFHRITRSIRETVSEYNSATSSARRLTEEMNRQFQFQKEMDDIARQRAIEQAHGNKFRIAQIEREYQQLAIQRESQRLDAEKAAKIKEQQGLQKELTELQRRISGLTTGSDAQHSQTLSEVKDQYKQARKLIADSLKDDPGWFTKQWRYLSASLRSGGFVAGMANPQGGNNLTRQLMNEEASAKRADLERAQNIVRQYTSLINAEDKRNKLIEERNRLTGKAEEVGRRYAELSQQIGAADEEKAKAIKQLQTVANAKAGLANASLGGIPRSFDLTENQRHGAFSLGTMVSVQQIHVREAVKQTAILERIEGKVGGPLTPAGY